MGLPRPPEIPAIPETEVNLLQYTDLAKQGLHLFPLQGKRPLVRWRDESTTDPDTLARWASQFPGCGWGIDCGRSGLLVIDDDRGKHDLAEHSLAAIEARHGDLPPTYTVQTPSGGYHYYYRGNGRNSASTLLGPGLDSRGAGGYVVAPCSPGYAADPDTIAPAPAWLTSLLDPARPEVLPPRQDPPDPDLPHNIARAIQYLQSAYPAIEGEGGDLTTYRTACRVRDLGISEDTCYDLMVAHWNDRCDPPWSPYDLAGKVRNAYRYAHLTPGQETAESIFPPWEDPEQPQIRKRLFAEANDLLSRPITIEYLVDQRIETPSTGLVFGDPSAGKSFTTLDLALAIACGTSWQGKIARQGVAIYFAGEGRHGLQRRIAAWRKHHQIDIPANHLWISEKRIEFTPQALREAREEIQEIQQQAGLPVSLVVVDTLARHIPAQADENSARDIGQFINAVDAIRDHFRCVVCVVHHSGKGGKETSRGSSAIRGAMDWEMRVEKNGAHNILWTKQKESELPPPAAFTLETVGIGNGAESAVPVPCDYVSAKEEALGGDAALLLSCLEFDTADKAIPVEDWKKAFYTALGDEIAPATKRQKWGRAKAKCDKSVTVAYEDGKVYRTIPIEEGN
jgi:hypothetical protein